MTNFRLITGPKIGVLVEPGNISQPESALDELNDNPEEAERIGDEGQKFVESRYEWANFAELVSSYVQSI